MATLTENIEVIIEFAITHGFVDCVTKVKHETNPRCREISKGYRERILKTIEESKSET